MTVDCLRAELFSFGMLGRDWFAQLNLEVRKVPSAHIVEQKSLAFRCKTAAGDISRALLA
jgi:hypothetical protein